MEVDCWVETVGAVEGRLGNVGPTQGHEGIPPVETAEFAKARGIDDEVAFAYWMPYTLRKRDAIIKAVNSRCRKMSHKYGIELPASVEHAHRLDEKNGDTFWADAIAKEMHNIGIAFKILDDMEHVLVGLSKNRTYCFRCEDGLHEEGKMGS